MDFNKDNPNIVHLDINSCFATIEQQANPLLRGKPVVVAAYESLSGCILASSIEAKRMGVKTGMRVMDGKKICPALVVLGADPDKYRFVHKKLFKLLNKYSSKVIPKSIDEFVFETADADSIRSCLEIKRKIREDIGEHVSVSVGISTNRYLAKVAAGRVKPDGLVVIDCSTFQDIYSGMQLTDLTGIKTGNKERLSGVGIVSVADFYNAPVWKLKIAFGGIAGLYWYLRLKGYEIDDFNSQRKTFGNSYAPPLPMSSKVTEILSRLCQKTGYRLRRSGYNACGVGLSVIFRNGYFWHKGVKTKKRISDSSDIYKQAVVLWDMCPVKSPLREIGIFVFNLGSGANLQLDIFEDVVKKERLTKSIDSINARWGETTIYNARAMEAIDAVKDRIAFGQNLIP